MLGLLAIAALGSLGLGQELSVPTNKGAFYQDCSIFQNPHVYGGPVCASDGETYANSVYLDCINHQNFRNVATLHSGACLPSEDYCKENLYYQPVCGSDNKTYSNVEALLCANHKQNRGLSVTFEGPCSPPDPCYREGTELYGTNSVCASNGYTYRNAGQVKCLQQYNDNLRIVHDGGCEVRHVYALYGSGARVCQIAKDRYEWNPLCGTDGVTYPNPFVYLCYKTHARVISDEECGTPTQNACAHVQSQDSLYYGEEVNSPDQAKNQVCGSDGKTYSSQYHLRCRTGQDKYLYLRHEGACSGPDDNPCGLIPREDQKSAVCGNDGKTYVSPEALWCASLDAPSKEISFLHDGQC